MDRSAIIKWARSSSLWFIETGQGCCADEALESFGARYDLERFGCVPQTDPRQADLLIVLGSVSYKAAPHLKSMYEQMLSPKYVLAVGACACGGGAFAPEYSYAVVPGLDQIIPVDVYVPGAHRPEAIMHGLITLQEKIRGQERALVQKLKTSFPGAVLKQSSFGRARLQTLLWIEMGQVREVSEILARGLEALNGFDWLENLSVMELEGALVLTYVLRSRRTGDTMILRGSAVPKTSADWVEVPSVAAIWNMATPLEAEAGELFGIRFTQARTRREGEGAVATAGFVSKTLPDGWAGFPLRKSYVFPEQVDGIPHSRAPLVPKPREDA